MLAVLKLTNNNKTFKPILIGRVMSDRQQPGTDDTAVCLIFERPVYF